MKIDIELSWHIGIVDRLIHYCWINFPNLGRSGIVARIIGSASCGTLLPCNIQFVVILIEFIRWTASLKLHYIFEIVPMLYKLSIARCHERPRTLLPLFTHDQADIVFVGYLGQL